MGGDDPRGCGWLAPHRRVRHRSAAASTWFSTDFGRLARRGLAIDVCHHSTDLTMKKTVSFDPWEPVAVVASARRSSAVSHHRAQTLLSLLVAVEDPFCSQVTPIEGQRGAFGPIATVEAPPWAATIVEPPPATRIPNLPLLARRCAHLGHPKPQDPSISSPSHRSTRTTRAHRRRERRRER